MTKEQIEWLEDKNFDYRGEAYGYWYRNYYYLCVIIEDNGHIFTELDITKIGALEIDIEKLSRNVQRAIKITNEWKDSFRKKGPIMNDKEIKICKKHTIQALENYINANSYEFDHTEAYPGSNESLYFILDDYKNELIKEVYRKKQ